MEITTRRDLPSGADQLAVSCIGGTSTDTRDRVPLGAHIGALRALSGGAAALHYWVEKPVERRLSAWKDARPG
jgi:hypothetical protein